MAFAREKAMMKREHPSVTRLRKKSVLTEDLHSQRTLHFMKYEYPLFKIPAVVLNPLKI